MYLLDIFIRFRNKFLYLLVISNINKIDFANYITIDYSSPFFRYITIDYSCHFFCHLTLYILLWYITSVYFVTSELFL